MTRVSQKTKAAAGEEDAFDRELAGVSEDQRWQEWMRRIEAVLFASATPVPRKELARTVGRGVSVEQLIKDIGTNLADRPYEIVQVSGGWMFRTKRAYTSAIAAASTQRDRTLGFTEMEMGVLCAIAYHQPIDRADLKDIFGKDISRDLLARLRFKDLIAAGPRSPKPGAPHTFVTTNNFLVTFDLQSLRDLPDFELQAEA